MARQRCPVCRSKRWHRDRATGLVVCEEGHILQGYLQEDNEAEGPSGRVAKKRYVRKNKTKKKRRQANPDLFHGPRLRFLYFQCAQIVLRRQIRALIHEWDLPAELETVARDLWAMYVSLTSLEPEPFKEDDDGDMEGGAAQALGSDAKVDADRDPMQQIYEELSDTETASESDPDPNAAEHPDVERAGAATSGADRHPQEPRARQKRKKQAALPFDPASVLRLQYTLVICYLSCLTLRVPVFMKDLLDLAASYKIVYLNALQDIPADMRKHLDMAQTEKEFLQTHVLPVAEPSSQRNVTQSFAHLVSAFMHMLRVNYSVTFPDVNAAPLLWKCVREASLPPFFYLTCRRLLVGTSAALGFDIAQSGAGLVLSEYPDRVLAASLVLSCKLLWGVDGRSRIPQDANDMAAALPRLHAWLDLAEDMQRRLPDTSIPLAARMNDLASLTGKDVDNFLDFCEAHLVSDPAERQLALGTLILPPTMGSIPDRFFPLPERSDSGPAENAGLNEARAAILRAFYSDLHPPIPGEAVDDEPLFAGQAYKLYNSGDRAGAMHPAYERILALVANIVGVSAQELEAGVGAFEKRLLRSPVSGGTKVPEPTIGTSPWEGYESRAFGEVRSRGGGIRKPPGPQSETGDTAHMKMPAILAPTVVR